MQLKAAGHFRPSILKKRGFALIATLSLMILLTVVAVGLLSLAQISLRSSSAGERQRAAQQNARMALQIALGELQKTLGPDSRASVRSDLLATNPASPKVLGVLRTTPSTPSSDEPAKYLQNVRRQGLTEMTWLVSSEGKLDPLTQAPKAASKETADLQSYVNASGSKEFVSVGKILMKTGTSNAVNGAYAWWIDDESQKACPATIKNSVGDN